jgi:hypothetical protein
MQQHYYVMHGCYLSPYHILFDANIPISWNIITTQMIEKLIKGHKELSAIFLIHCTSQKIFSLTKSKLPWRQNKHPELHIGGQCHIAAEVRHISELSFACFNAEYNQSQSYLTYMSIYFRNITQKYTLYRFYCSYLLKWIKLVKFRTITISVIKLQCV